MPRECECGRLKPHPCSKCCTECDRLDRERYADARRSKLINEVRALLERHYPDWLDGYEIRHTINDEESSSALWQLHKRGEIEKRRIGAVEYRLRRAA